MKIFTSSFIAIVIFSSISAKETYYTGSTPAGAVVKNFLGISLTDSVDFIRWKLAITDRNYKLHCNYGIGKPNTNGFYNGGKIIEISGETKRENNIYTIFYKGKVLKIAELNNDLLHFLDNDNFPLKGNGGWSYTINNLSPIHSDMIAMTSKQVALRDSMGFEGRTPCGVPGIKKNDQCYKMKWYVVLYADSKKNQPTTFKLSGTSFRKEGIKQGNWKIVVGKGGRVIYQLLDDKREILVTLVKADEGILLFTDTSGKLLVGDLDFSYTLNRKF